jgi:hypothetical protein
MKPSCAPSSLAGRRGERAKRGSVLVLSLFCVAILSFLLASTLLTSENGYHVAFQTASWQEAIQGAEAGVDLAMAALNGGQWSAWQTASGSPPRTTPIAVTAVAATEPPGAGNYNYQTITLSHAGEGNQQVAIFVTIDPPTTLSSAPNGQWMRLRAVGTTTLTGSAQASLMAADGALRKMSFFTNRDTGRAIATPQTSRFVEVIASRNGSTHAIVLQKDILMSGSSTIDSFDSSDPTKSTLLQYDPTKRQSHGDVAMANSASADFKSCSVYGSVYYNGPAPARTAGVHGSLIPGYTNTFAGVTAPDSTWVPTDPSVISVAGTMILVAGTKTAPARYKLSALTIGGGQLLTILPSLAGGDSYIEIWVTGGLTTSGSGIVMQMPGVHSTYFVQGDIKMSGGSFINKSNVAANLLINGVDPPAGTIGSMTISGNGDFTGVINAPNYNFLISGSGEYSGALIGDTINFSGGADFHYDEALSKGGTSYSVANWYEDLH